MSGALERLTELEQMKRSLRLVASSSRSATSLRFSTPLRLSSSSSSSASASSAAREKLRATAGPAVAKRAPHLWRKAALGGSALFGLYVAYRNDFSAAKARAALEDAWSRLFVDRESLSDPNQEDLLQHLGDRPEGYLSVILSVEDVLLRRYHDPRFGFVYRPREGAVELLRELLNPANCVWLTLWSENDAAVANEISEKLFAALSGPPAHTQPLCKDHIFLRDGRKAARERAGADGSAGAATSSASSKTWLEFFGIFMDDQNKRKEKRLEYFNRRPEELLLVDHDPVSAELNPLNTMLVEKMRALPGEGIADGAMPSSGAPADANETAGPDLTCEAIKALVRRIREDVQNTGEVNVPRSLDNLRRAASEAGFPTYATGLFHYLGHEAEVVRSLEQRRRETGLGGALRRALRAAKLDKKLDSAEMAKDQAYFDPVEELPMGALLLERVQAYNGRLSQPQ